MTPVATPQAVAEYRQQMVDAGHPAPTKATSAYFEISDTTTKRCVREWKNYLEAHPPALEVAPADPIKRARRPRSGVRAGRSSLRLARPNIAARPIKPPITTPLLARSYPPAQADHQPVQRPNAEHKKAVQTQQPQLDRMQRPPLFDTVPRWEPQPQPQRLKPPGNVVLVVLAVLVFMGALVLGARSQEIAIYDLYELPEPMATRPRPTEALPVGPAARPASAPSATAELATAELPTAEPPTPEPPTVTPTAEEPPPPPEPTICAVVTGAGLEGVACGYGEAALQAEAQRNWQQAWDSRPSPTPDGSVGLASTAYAEMHATVVAGQQQQP